MPKIIALIPARAGSKRLPGKAVKVLGNKPLIRWTVYAAQQSGIFDDILVCADSQAILDASGAVNTWRRPPISDTQSDIEWVREALKRAPGADAYAILRPTSPFRTGNTIGRAWQQFSADPSCHSLRAVQPVKEHPGKMWVIDTPSRMSPLIVQDDDETPTHSRATQTLQKVYVQNASLEMFWSFVPQAFDTISGTRVMPFFTEGIEGVDINTPEDWAEAERLVATHYPNIEYLG